MLLDEATSALDAAAEREVQTALDRIMVRQEGGTGEETVHNRRGESDGTGRVQVKGLRGGNGSSRPLLI